MAVRARRAGLGPPALALLATLVLLIISAPVALAHGEVVAAEPQAASEVIAPPRVLLGFNEVVTPSLSSLRVLDLRGRSVAKPPRFAPDGLSVEASLDPLEPGFYTVVWSAFTPSDGHTTRGAFSFRVVRPPEAVAPSAAAPPAPEAPPEVSAPLVVEPEELPPPFVAFAKWLWLVAVVLSCGLALARVAFLEDASAMARLRDPQRAFAVAAALAIVPLVLTRAIVTLSADAPDTLVMAQRTLEAARDLFATRYGMLVALVGAGVLASAGLGRVPWASAGLAAASLAIVASSGHAATPARGAWAAVGTDWLHLLFASIWLGGLAALVFANVPYGGTRPAAAAFHRVVWVGIAMLAASGLFAAAVEVVEPRGLASGYGAALVGKQVLVGGLVIVHAVAPRVPFARALGLALGVGLLATVAVLGESAPPAQRLAARAAREELAVRPSPSPEPSPSASPTPASTARVVQLVERANGQFRLAASLSPARVGKNDVIVLVRDLEGRPVDDAIVSAFFTSAVLDVQSNAMRFAPLDGGRYRLEGVDFAALGEWEVRVVVTHARLDFAIEPFRVQIDPP